MISTTNGILVMFNNNQALVNTIRRFTKYPRSHIRHVLSPEWDLLSPIWTALNKFSKIPWTRHIKGHQDQNKPYESLSLPAQLNVNVDRLATRALHEVATPFTEVPLHSSSRVQLMIAGTTITSHHSLHLTTTYDLPPLFEYYQTRFRWSAIVRQYVDWDLFNSVYQRKRSHWHYYNKWYQYTLPIGAQI